MSCGEPGRDWDALRPERGTPPGLLRFTSCLRKWFATKSQAVRSSSSGGDLDRYEHMFSLPCLVVKGYCERMFAYVRGAVAWWDLGPRAEDAPGSKVQGRDFDSHGARRAAPKADRQQRLL